MNTLGNLIDFLETLKKHDFYHRIYKTKEDCILVDVAVPGEHWAVEFFTNRTIRFERFRSDGGVMENGNELEEIEKIFGNNNVQTDEKLYESDNFKYMIEFLERLQKHKIQFRLDKIRDESILVEVSIPGELWEIEFIDKRFFEEDRIEIEKYLSIKTSFDFNDVEMLIKEHVDYNNSEQ